VAPVLIRHATEDDGARCAAIYRPYVTDTVISFEEVPPTAAEMTERIATAQRSHAWLVAEDDGADGGEVVGYAYGGTWKPRAAYRFVCEVSVYLVTGRRRTGVGRALYTSLFDALAARGYVLAVAGMTLPNDASVGLHRAMGFEVVGTHRAVGWKHDAWHDVAWAQRRIA
jgi:L-amino acid N-acyltransferase YncA